MKFFFFCFGFKGGSSGILGEFDIFVILVCLFKKEEFDFIFGILKLVFNLIDKVLKN